MRRMEFPEVWINLIMGCVKSVSYSILVNGQPVGNIKPSRGIRQGDPLSPYLFLLCAEALSAMLTRAEKKRVLTGVPTSKKGPTLSHLFFADDGLIFCKANSVEWRRLTRILEKYEVASGQKLNKEKTSIFFRRNTSPEKRMEITQLSGLQATESYDKYLGLPTLVGKSRTQAFASIKDRIWNCINNWKTKFLTQAGKEILIKAVVQAIPTYCISVFLLPKALCKEIQGMMQRFWWGHKDNTSRIHWMSWERMGKSKARGGLGFRDLEVFNKALLPKQLWRLLQAPDSLAAKILKAKYYPSNSILEAQLGNRPSYLWRSFMAAQPVLKNGMLWRIGNGDSISVWLDRWLPRPTSYKVFSPRKILDQNARVSEFIDQNTRMWKAGLISEIFLEDEAALICSIPLSPLPVEDRIIWQGTKNGIFSVRSAYFLELENLANRTGGVSKPDEGKTWKEIWNLKVPNVVKLFLWKALHNLLPTRTNLARKGIITEAACPICGRMDESVEHILWSCSSSMDVWGGGPKSLQKCDVVECSFPTLFEGLMRRCNKEDLEFFAITARKIWLRQNSVVHGELFTHPSQLLHEAKNSLEEFQQIHNEVGNGPHNARELTEVKWKPPVGCMIKLNWDARLNMKERRVGIGLIARDSRGVCLAARSMSLNIHTDATTAEALAAVHAVMFCKELGYANLIF
jgi:hypothetical protein